MDTTCRAGDKQPGAGVPDIGETFKHESSGEVRSYCVTGWLRRRQPRVLNPAIERIRSEAEKVLGVVAGKRQVRVAGPDGVPLEWCLRDQAEYVSGAGVSGVIARVGDVQVTGRADWPERTIGYTREIAVRMAGEPLL